MKVVNLKDETKMDRLDTWLKELVYPGQVQDFVEEKSTEGSEDEVKRNLILYTDEHEYFITAIEKESDEGYLGCGVLARKSRAGEDWARGNDLPDGPFNKDTWTKIIYAIVNYELVKLTPFKKPDTIPQDIA